MQHARQRLGSFADAMDEGRDQLMPKLRSCATTEIGSLRAVAVRDVCAKARPSHLRFALVAAAVNCGSSAGAPWKFAGKRRSVEPVLQLERVS